MIKNPLVSIIIPVYNGSNYLKKAIDSALSQTYKNIEIIVVNDGSTDNGETEKVALSYGDKISYYLKENGGVSSALNFGISKMKGDYFSWLSHDDEYTQTKIEKQVELLSCQNQIIVCSERQIDKNSNFLSQQNDYTKLIDKSPLSWQDEIKLILTQTLYSGCALLIPKQAFIESGYFDESLRYNQDFDMWLRICFTGYSWVYSNEVGVLSRVHAQQVTQTRRDLFYTDYFKLGQRLIPELAEKSQKDNNFLFLYAKRCAKYNLSKNVKACVDLAKSKKLFSVGQRIQITFTALYGKIRPIIRKIYYKLFKKVKTQ